jgi:hypothetical protein
METSVLSDGREVRANVYDWPLGTQASNLGSLLFLG